MKQINTIHVTVNKVGPFVCMVKTHLDIVYDFSEEIVVYAP